LKLRNATFGEKFSKLQCSIIQKKEVETSILDLFYLFQDVNKPTHTSNLKVQRYKYSVVELTKIRNALRNASTGIRGKIKECPVLVLGGHSL